METISWKTKEYHHTEKTGDWYWIVGIITISIALISIILNNIIFAVLILVSSFTLSLFASKRPETINVEIDNDGLMFGENHYPYEELDSFWIETREERPKIIFKSKKVLNPFVVVFIENIDTEKVHEKLSEYLKEVEHTEPLLEKVLMYFGF